MVLFTAPAGNRQRALQYEIALWTKVMYPLAVLVMMILALPFASYHKRQGGVGGRIVAGIMLGLGFYTMTRLSRRSVYFTAGRCIRGGDADAHLPHPGAP